MTTRTSRNPNNSYIDLKINGRLFPSFISMNFKKFKLEEIVRNISEDPCKQEMSEKEIKLELRKYQLFLSSYLDYRSPYRSVLIYGTVGSGKTATAINVYNVLYNYNPQFNYFLLIKASLRNEWINQLQTWLQKNEFEFRYRNIIFINYDSPFADRQFLDAIKNVDNSKKSLYMVDEAHNFIRNVYSNVSTQKGKRAQIIYDYIIQDYRENPDTRILLLSGTPAINNPFELALLFNMLRPGIFPKSENDFNQLFIGSGIYQTINKTTKNMFQRRIMGLVSYYSGTVPNSFATKTMHYVDVQMSEYQEDIYSFYEDIEAKIATNMRGQGSSQIYKSYTRQASNMVWPPISQQITGENRPRPNKFKISEREAQKLSEGKNTDTSTTQISEYVKALDQFVKGFDNYLRQQDQEDIKNKYTIIDDVQKFMTKYDNDFERFHQEEQTKSRLYEAMYTSSAKMLNIVFNIMMSPGPTVVYSNYVLMEGLEIFKVYLKYFGFYNFMNGMQYQEGKVGYVEFHGGIKDMAVRNKGKEEFNRLDNKYGTKLKIMLISPAGSEGLNLQNVRQMHIMEPYWNEVRITQTVGRAIRYCSHKNLPFEERHVDVYRYKSVRKNKNKITTDQYIEDLARSKEGLLQSFLDAMKEVAVDCNLFKAHNMLTQEYKCFQFDETAQFDKHPNAAYRDDINDDLKMDNGLNSTNSISMKIKVMKIKAVIQLTSSYESTTEYSKPAYYWYYPKTNVVYDYDLHFAYGRVAIDENNIPIKLDKDTYIIDYVIPIPRIDV